MEVIPEVQTRPEAGTDAHEKPLNLFLNIPQKLLLKAVFLFSCQHWGDQQGAAQGSLKNKQDSGRPSKTVWVCHPASLNPKVTAGLALTFSWCGFTLPWRSLETVLHTYPCSPACPHGPAPASPPTAWRPSPGQRCGCVLWGERQMPSTGFMSDVSWILSCTFPFCCCCAFSNQSFVIWLQPKHSR